MGLCLIIPRALSFLPASVSLCGIVYIWASQRRLPVIDKKLLLFFAAFSALAIASASWSPDPAYSFEKSLKISAVFLSGLFPLMMVSAIPRDIWNVNKIVCASAILCALAGAVFCFEYSTDFSITRSLMGMHERETWSKPIAKGFLLNRSSVFLVLLSMPVSLLILRSELTNRKKITLLCIMAAGLALMLLATNSQTSQFAALIALPALAFPACHKKARYGLAILVSIVALACPFVIPPIQAYLFPEKIELERDSILMQASIPHRLEVWTFVSEEIATAPLTGQGLEATRFLKSEKVMPYMRTDHVLHPHNAVLQIWIEFGVVGMLLTIAFLFFIFNKIDDKSHAMQRFSIVFFIVCMAVLSMGYGLWQAWLIGMIQSLIALGLIA